MRTGLRLALLVCVSAISLGVAGTAMAAFTPRLTVNQVASSSTSSDTSIKITIPKDDLATLKVTIYVPLGYSATLNQAPGTQVGTVKATAQAKAISPDAILPLEGVIKTDNPGNYTTVPASIACAGATPHTAVFLLVLTAAGQTLTVPAYVDSVTTGAEAAFASSKITICLPSPDIPAASGGATFGAKVLEAGLLLTNVFKAPTSAGRYVWSAIFTPYATNSGIPNPAATVESRAIVSLPTQISIGAKVTNKKKRTIGVIGVVTENSVGVSDQKVVLIVGKKPDGKGTPYTTKSSGGGKFGGVLSLKKKGTYYLTVGVIVPDRDASLTECGNAKAPSGCVSATLTGFTAISRTIKIKV